MKKATQKMICRRFQLAIHFKNLLKIKIVVLVIAALGLSSNGFEKWNGNNGKNFKSWSWKEINPEAKWSPRAGLQVLSHKNKIFLLGGRTPLDPQTLPFPVPGASIIWGDVWKSKNIGKSWKKLLDTDNENHWPARAYFQAVSKKKYMYVMGGQNFNIIPNPFPDPFAPPFISQSDFFNDVWRSMDGINWEPLVENAPWPARAGLSAVVYKNEIYIMGGSVNDDSSIIGPGGPARIYFNDVWKSKNGKDWEMLTEHAPWAARAGGIAVVKDEFIYMIGGEDGFICNEFTPRCPPYYNDVWRTKDGQNWELVVENAEWPARPGHQVVVAQDRFVLFGGFGLGPDITIPANPMDVWISNKGKVWKKVSDSPWNAMSPMDIKYDFDALVVRKKWSKTDEILTFGGDRETFNFIDPLNYLNVDNDVWKYSLNYHGQQPKMPKDLITVHQNYPNPFHHSTSISMDVNTSGKLRLDVYNFKGKYVRSICNKNIEKGSHQFKWDGTDSKGNHAEEGIYLLKASFKNTSKIIKMVLRH